MIDLSQSHPASFLWICSQLSNVERLQVGLSNTNLFAILKPLFDSLKYNSDCLKKASLAELEYDFLTQMGEDKILADKKITILDLNLNYKIAAFWKNHNETQLTNHYNPHLISDFEKARKRGYEEIEIKKVCLKLGAETVEAAIRLAAASKKNQISMYSFKLLCSYAKTLDAQSKNGNTALHWALKSGNENFAITLINMNANCKISNSIGETPLHFAALLDTDNLASALVLKKANLYTKDHQGKIALDWALSKNKKACIQFLTARQSEI
ncbi:MAG: ankyrin repeat domain-containing protein [Candidatus Protochlamydia sp.]|nr:ankyrin repeat domain-containing protein [Candidatus Protochlamydia sp.]